MPRPWHGALSAVASRHVGAIACDLGNRILDEAFRDTSPFDDWSFATGHAGVALAFEWLDRCYPSEGWDVAAKTQLTAAVRCIERMEPQSMPAGLFGGITGVAHVASLMSREGFRYQRLIRDIHVFADAYTGRFITFIWNQAETAAAYYDLISGVVGIGVYGIGASRIPVKNRLIGECLSYLIGARKNDLRSRYLISPLLIASPAMMDAFPNGYVDMGMAHGLAGVLAFASLCQIQGYSYPGLHDFIAEVAEIVSLGSDVADDASWPAAVDLLGQALPARTAWCYGAPGLTRALRFAGDALKDRRMRRAAREHFEAAAQQPKAKTNLTSPTFCHGYAGVLQCALRFANESPKGFDIKVVNTLLEELLSYYDRACPLGFRELGSEIQAGAGFLEGAAGVILVLLAASASVEPTWDRLVLLS